MEVNQVRFGNYTIGNSTQEKSKKKQQEATENAETKQPESNKSVNREDVLSEMDFIALQNKPKVSSSATKDVNPSEFLDEGRISDIEAMMQEFENGVNAAAEVIGEEFPDMSEANKNALAARLFLQG